MLLQLRTVLHPTMTFVISPQQPLSNRNSQDPSKLRWRATRTPDFTGMAQTFALIHGVHRIETSTAFLSEGKHNIVMLEGVQGHEAAEFARQVLGSPDAQHQRKEQAKLVFQGEPERERVDIIGFSGPYWTLYILEKEDHTSPVRREKPRLKRSKPTVESDEEYKPSSRRPRLVELDPEDTSLHSISSLGPKQQQQDKPIREDHSSHRSDSEADGPSAVDHARSDGLDQKTGEMDEKDRKKDSDSEDESGVRAYEQEDRPVTHIFEGEDVDSETFDPELLSNLARIMNAAGFTLNEWN